MDETPNPAPQTPAMINAALDARSKLIDELHPGSPEALGAYFELAGTTADSFTVRNIT